ncbi:hypothetical protein BP6252_13992 [Coleophoma cylindrospora]|uniref:Xylanolytic transcriptional activator regulatory domain-containing protein n=1 Tax=Coleophoma cylindrospora TaxID=1849047 RepID=A0A3D8Q4W9_9HELO|nr:hypothetical protein BP6252_13992 [Coleophoma cylindrospora]
MPGTCHFRQLPRTRRTFALASHSDSRPGPPEDNHSSRDSAIGLSAASVEPTDNDDLRDSVRASQANERSGHIQLYYGTSSQFAFLQQLHRALLSDDSSLGRTPGSVQDVSPGLEIFMQNAFFFGIAPFGDLATENLVGCPNNEFPLELMESYIDNFMSTYYPLVSFVTEEHLRTLVRTLCNVETASSIPPQSKTIILLVLAIGALSTENLESADQLLARAKAENASTDEAVNLRAVHISLLLGLYQMNIGRPHSGYLHLGVACRKAFAMGLHMDTNDVGSDATCDTNQEFRRATMWCLYFHEIWQSLILGRKCAIDRADISCPLPTNNPMICSLARLADIMASCVKSIYGHRTQSLWELYRTAEGIHNELRQFAETYSIAAASKDTEESRKSVELLILTNIYFHSVLLTFRPFLVARASCKRRYQTQMPLRVDGVEGDEMWLRQACRYAMDAAQDQISFICSRNRTIESGKRMIYNCFFMESSCTVLLFDVLGEDYKFSHNVEYINAAIRCISGMVQGITVMSALKSIKQMLSIVEHESLARRNRASFTPHSHNLASASSQLPNHLDSHGNEMDSAPDYNDSRFMHYPQQEQDNVMIHMRDKPDTLPYDHSIGSPPLEYDFDIFTTNLSNFFPVDLTFQHGQGPI